MTPDQIQAWDHFASTLGIPAFIIVSFMLITAGVFVRVVWPDILKRQQKLDTEQAERQKKIDAEYTDRHKGYLAQMGAYNEENKATTQVLIMLQQKAEGHDVAALRRNDDLRELLNRRFDELLRAVQETRK